MSHHHDHSNETENEGRLRIIRLIKGVLETRPNPALTTFIQREHAKATSPELKGLLALLITDNEANRIKARDALSVLERQVQEAEAGGVAPKVETLQPIDSNKVMSNIIDLTTKRPQAAGGSSRPFHLQSEDPEAEAIQWPAGPEPDAGHIAYTIITAETTPEQLANSHLTTVAGLCIGIKGQNKIAHGFGFYLPLPPGKVKFNGNDPIQLKIAMSRPETITLYDDHAAPRLPGMSHFWAVHETMTDGYRFLLDLEIIPVNGRYVLSLKPQLQFDRHGNQQQFPCNIVHMHKLLSAAENLAFIGFTGITEIS